ncbi:hypothetical protein [Alteromonas sp. C1M14]|uniref:hypothetical protein n=1 Tax=Alteromonas sp. C1M14 TaxID=2841567 RepID=UPI001C09AC31|nr:hypothetical protein [Alteromonas sp. C1M14]MBU2980040.1 hypothetical protein [Alteromonas sp. C1M14]
MSEQHAPTLGPVACGTLLCPNLDTLTRAYTDYLDMQVVEEGTISSALADGWAMPQAAGLGYRLLGSKSGYNWLRIIEDPNCLPAKPIASLGWMSLEVLVEDVYALAEKLRNSPFAFIGEPKALDLSPDIEACQVVGPAGEVLYLTTIRNPVPPFDLPMATCEVDRLFIPVLAVPNRDESTALYHALGSESPLNFDTKVTVVNRALGHPIDQRMPVASAQLQQQNFIEVDEVVAFSARPTRPCGLCAGITMVSFMVTSLATIKISAKGGVYQSDSITYNNQPAALYQGTGGELIELIQR